MTTRSPFQTFRARGVALPATTPSLGGCRVRSAGKSGIDVVVPNPSGAQGSYILSPAGLSEICEPTVHDVMLLRCLSDAGDITPDCVRHAAHLVAIQGFAGRNVMLAAEQAVARDRAQIDRTHHLLITTLITQALPPGFAGASAADWMSHYADAVLLKVAGALRLRPGILVAGMQAIAEAFAPIGFAQKPQQGRIPRLVDRLATVASEMVDWLAADPANDVGGIGLSMMAPVRFGCAIGRAAVLDAQSQLNDPMTLLRQWMTRPSGLMDQAGRAAWLLDGWEGFCLMWMSADSDLTRRAVLLELPQLLPILPREAIGWTSVKVPDAAMEPSCRVVSREDVWRSGGAAFSRIERNEMLRARSL